MNGTRGVTAAGLATMIAAGVLMTPPTAHAAPVLPLDGTFRIESDAGGSGTWVITSTCSSPDSCTAQVKSDLWTGTAQASGNAAWHMAVDVPDGIICEVVNGPAINDRRAVSITTHEEYFFSQLIEGAGESTTGTVDITWKPIGDRCGSGSKHRNLTLTKV
jgi:hypothetical protein